MRIAVLGGTFDPIHNGHLAAAEAVARLFAVDQVHFVTTFTPPHKPSRRTSPFHRFAMVAIAVAPHPAFRASSIELDTLEKQYTVDTLSHMRERHPEASLLFIAGTDMYAEIDTWKDYRRLFDLAHFVVVNRPGFAFREDIAAFSVVHQPWTGPLPESPRVFHVPSVVQPVSSSELRTAIRNGSGTGGQLPAPVLDYIQRHELYI